MPNHPHHHYHYLAVNLYLRSFLLKAIFELSDPYSDFENRFPDVKEEICSSPVVHRYMWEYKCLTFNLSVLTDPGDRCRYADTIFCYP